MSREQERIRKRLEKQQLLSVIKSRKSLSGIIFRVWRSGRPTSSKLYKIFGKNNAWDIVL